MGAKVGASDFSLGATLGCGVVGETGRIGVGDETGAAVGDVVGDVVTDDIVGDALGELVGDDVGETDTPATELLVGDEDGSEVGEADAGVGLLVGEVLGDAENDALDGEDVGEVETTLAKSIAPG